MFHKHILVITGNRSRRFEATETRDDLELPDSSLSICLWPTGVPRKFVLDRGSKIPFREKKEMISLIGRERNIEKCSRVGQLRNSQYISSLKFRL